ncbi:hypothetical protein [Actinomadura sediminis]|uniref:DUF222 domain-containing protein n=1 Tax=Actinomadura sediminis TaxID=1038904 RepID=A0ABW3ET09_9ACTN
MTDRIVSAGDLTPEQRRIHRVEHILRRDGGSPGSALDGLASIVEDETWRKVPSGPDGAPRFTSFTAFVEARRPYGLGYSVRQLRALLKLCHPDEDKKADVRDRMDAMRAEVERLIAEEIPEALPVGRPTEKHCDTNIKPDRVEHIVARLKRDDPALAEQVVNGDLTANAAARAKGWRRPRVVVSSPERTAASLRKHMTLEDLHALARLLLDEEDN